MTKKAYFMASAACLLAAFAASRSGHAEESAAEAKASGSAAGQALESRTQTSPPAGEEALAGAGSASIAQPEGAEGAAASAAAQKSAISFEGFYRPNDSNEEGQSGAASEQEKEDEDAEAQEEKNILSEALSPAAPPLEKGWSWIFDSRLTSREMAVVPTYYMSKTYGPNWGLRFFVFSPEKPGWYFSTALVNKIFSPHFKWTARHRQDLLPQDREIQTYALLSNYFEPFYESKGMNTRFEDKKRLYFHKFHIRHERVFKSHHPFFYGIEEGAFFFKERQPYLSSSESAISEFFMYMKVNGGYDSRADWKNPSKGQYHKASLACAPLLEGGSFCLADLDLRAYIPLKLFKFGETLALRAFAGTSLFANAPYSMSYTLGGSSVLRGYTQNRFRGDKAYFAQSELRANLWKERVSGVLFFELGETAARGSSFEGFLYDYGFGFRFGMPPSYQVKLRVDMGFSKEQSGEPSYNLIVNFLQAF